MEVLVLALSRQMLILVRQVTAVLADGCMENDCCVV